MDGVLFSTDGLEWKGERLERAASLQAFAYAENSRRWVAVGSGGTILTKY